jgi:hypothetical protein
LPLGVTYSQEEREKMILVNGGANEAGAWAEYSNGLEIRYIVSMKKTYITREDGSKEVHEGRVGI